MAKSLRPFLMFQGAADQAIALYTSLFADAELTVLARHGPGGARPEGGVQRAELVIAGQRLSIFDSPVDHGFGFTPSLSLFVECEDEAEIDWLTAALSEGGQVMMPLGAYDFSRRFAWVSDRFGVSWQLNLG